MKECTSEGGMRLDVFLTREGMAESRIKARDLVKGGAVMVNGRIARKPALVLREGDRVEVSEDAKPLSETRLKSEDLHITVLYEDAACMVIDKPGGIAVHPGVGMAKDEPTVLHGVAHLFRERSIPFASAAVLVHRLDRDTTGCLLVAKTPAAHKALQEQFAARTVRKLYLALVAGIPDPPAAVIDASIGRSNADRTKMAVTGTGRTREARTTYRTLGTSSAAEAALLTCELHTGRTHQIRVHMKTIGHPLLGDTEYASKQSERIAEQYGIDRLCLHAWKLTFVSPADGKEHAVETSIPSSFAATLKKMAVPYSHLKSHNS